MKRYQFASIIIEVILLLLFVDSLKALPRFALKGGEAWCGGCHLNPTGGGMRTKGGDEFAMKRLPMWDRGPKFSADISEGLRLGVDLRSQFLYFSEHTVGVQTLTDSLSHTTTTSIDKKASMNGLLEMAMPIYISATLSPAIQAYARFDPVTNGAWEVYGLVHFIHPSGDIWEAGSVLSDAYLKIGAFLPTFGIRFDDHTVYTRGGTYTLSGYSPAGMFWEPNYKDEGAELGISLFDYHAFITADILNGNEMNPLQPFKLDPMGPYAVSLRAEVTGSLIDSVVSAEIGGSAYLHDNTHLPNQSAPSGLADTSLMTTLIAVHGGIRAGPVRILAEVDFGKNIFHPLTHAFTAKANALAIETAFDLLQGLAGIFRFDNYKDQDETVNLTEVKHRVMFGLQWFPVRFLEFRPEVRLATVTAPNPDAPSERLDHTETTALLQTHIYF